jgi:hypothetical protein
LKAAVRKLKIIMIVTKRPSYLCVSIKLFYIVVNFVV